MGTGTLSNRRIAIFDDNHLNLERLTDMVTRCGATPVPVDGPVPRLNEFKAFLDSLQTDLVICDHHLSLQRDYAPFLGAEAVAMCYVNGIAAILVTAFENADAESSLRKFRRHIPALVRSPDDFNKAHLEAALLQAEKEVYEQSPPPERVPHRVIMTIKRIEQRASMKIVKVMMAQWDATKEIGFPLDLIPMQFHPEVRSGNFLIAEVNVEAKRQEDLFFDNFELPNPDVLKNAQSLFECS